MGERLTDYQIEQMWKSMDAGPITEGEARMLLVEVREVRASRASPPPCSCTCHVGACTSCGCERRASPPPDPGAPLALRSLLLDACHAIVTRSCGHAVVCADPKCRVAKHDHEDYGEDGWGCEGEECECVPACEGFAPQTCPPTTKKRDTAARLQLAAWAEPPPDPAQDPEARRLERRKAQRLMLLLENRAWFLARCPARKRKEAEELRTRLRAARAALLDYVCGKEDADGR